ncbi:MAG: ISL3 family transposase [Thermodesulfobacteriota bacterium]
MREPILFAVGKRRCLKAFSRLVVQLCQLAPIKHVALFLGVGWDLVKNIYKKHLLTRFRKRKLNQVRYIAVDEFAVRKGHHYLTAVMDLETGQILHLQEGKDALALISFLVRLKLKKAHLKAVAMDMSPAYLEVPRPGGSRQAVRLIFPEVDVVHDPYHIVALANAAIDETRRDLARELAGPDRKIIKGTRFLLLKGLENPIPRGLERLMNLMEVNQPLYQAYLLKEDLRTFWNCPNPNIGAETLESWIQQARATNLPHFPARRGTETLGRHRAGFLAYFKHRISTDPLEGLNNKIKVLKRQAYGFRDKSRGTRDFVCSLFTRLPRHFPDEP